MVLVIPIIVSLFLRDVVFSILFLVIVGREVLFVLFRPELRLFVGRLFRANRELLFRNRGILAGKRGWLGGKTRSEVDDAAVRVVKKLVHVLMRSERGMGVRYL